MKQMGEDCSAEAVKDNKNKQAFYFNDKTSFDFEYRLDTFVCRLLSKLSSGCTHMVEIAFLSIDIFFHKSLSRF